MKKPFSSLTGLGLTLFVAIIGLLWPRTVWASVGPDASFKASPLAPAKALPQMQTPAEDALAKAARADECEALCELAASVEAAPFGYVLGRRSPLGRIFLYDDTSLLAEYDTNGNEVAKYDYGGDRLIRLTRSDEGTRYFSFDGLGSVTALTTTTGAVTAAYHLDAWGNYRFTSELAPSKNRFGFTGHYWDNEAGLYYAKARFYDPFTARFTQADSFLGNIDDPPSLHRYFYGHANPTRFVDPTGHSAEGDNFWGWFAFHLSGSLLEAPTQALDRIQGLLTPGDESNSGRAATQQRKWLDVAGNKRADPVTRTFATMEAMKLQGAVVVEETIVRPAANVPANARKVGTHAYEAMTATDRTAMAVGVLGATAAFAEATGGLVPLVPERSLGTKLIGSTETRILSQGERSVAQAEVSNLPGSAAHRAARWEEYQARGGGWSRERWSNVYEQNMGRATRANEAADVYHEGLGWGRREVTVDVEGVPRRLDIADEATFRGREVKTGYQSATQENLWEIQRDQILREKGWDIQWRFEGRASRQLREALGKAGLPYTGGTR